MDSSVPAAPPTPTAPSPLSPFGARMKQFAYVSGEPTARPRRSPRLHGGNTPPRAPLSPPAPRASTLGRRRRAETRRTPPPTAPSPRGLPALKKRRSAGYAPPSRYAHLDPLTDVLAPGLILLFVGVNPGVATATAGHAYAHPSNLFWRLLHSSGITTRRMHPSEDRRLPELYECGNTNIVGRPTKDQSELSKAEMAEGTPVLEAKVRTWRPEAVCLVGKGIWEAVCRYRYGRIMGKDEFKYGWQHERENMGVEKDKEGTVLWAGARVFVACSTSGLAASLRPPQKEEIWRPLGEWVARRREERKSRSSGEGDNNVQREQAVDDAKAGSDGLLKMDMQALAGGSVEI